MKVRRFDFALVFQSAIVFGLGLSLATPVIEQIGYIVPGLFLRALFTALFVTVYTVFYLFPVVVVSIPLLLAGLAVLYYRNIPIVVEWVTSILTIPQPADALFWPLLILAGITLALFVIVFRFRYSLLLLFVVGLAAFVPLWYLFIDSAYPSSITYSIFWLMLLSYHKGTELWSRLPQRNRRKQEEIVGLRNGWLGYTVSLLSIAVLITLILPKDLGPVQWHSLQAWVNENFTFLNRLRSSETNEIRGDGGTFGFYAFGSQEGAELGGPLWLDETVLIEVRGQGGIYLRGRIKDTYTGRHWKKTEALEGRDFFAVPREALLDLLTDTEVTIKHKRLRTSSVFSMLYPQDVSSLPGALQIGQNSSMVMSESIPLNHEYTVKGLDLAYRSNFAELEREEDLSTLDYYLDLPSDLPSRVKELALEVAGEKKGYYNRIKALETFLRHNYSYNRNVPEVAGNRDFVDYFLFDRNEGYCTYFATALAVMGRAAGIPTRYVSGFSVPDEESEDGVYEVAGTNAHAWVEAYIPGLGWLPFEATPGFSTSADLPRHRDTAESDAYAVEDEEGQVAPFYGRDYYDHHPDSTAAYPGVESRISAGIFIAVLLKILTAVLLTAMLVFIAHVAYRYRRVKKMIGNLEVQNPRRRAVGYYLIALSLLDRINLGKWPGETPRKYSKRIIRRVYFLALNLNFREVSEGINLALYSQEEITPELAKEAEQFFRYIFKHYLAKVGRLTALFEILLKGKHFTEDLMS